MQRYTYLLFSSQQLTINKPLYKTLCIHWKRLPPQLMFPSLKDNFVWVSLENGYSIDKNIKKENIASQIVQIKNLKDSNLFIHRYSLLIYCVTCKKEIFDFYPQASSPADIQIIQKEKLTPFPIRDYFLKPINQESMFYSNLQYPKSFQKEKRNCAILISQFKNTFLESVIRLLAFTPTFNAISQNIDPQKIKSPVLRSLFKLVKTISTGQNRILKFHDFESTFFSEFPQFLSYENRKPISILFKIFTEIQNEFKFTDTYCKSKEIINDERTEWGFDKHVGKYSPLREMLLSKFSNIEQCFKCHIFRTENTLTRQFECLKLQPVTGNNPYFSNTLGKRKSIELNVIKAIEATLESQIPYLSQPAQHHCERCIFDTVHQTKVIIEPGNYLFFEVQTKESIKLIMPRQINLNELDSRKFIVDESFPVYEFIGGIYKDTQDRSLYPEEYGTIVYHNQNKKFNNFYQRNSTEHETPFLQKPFNVLLYKRKANQTNIPITKNINSTLYLMQENELEVQNPIPLPDLYQIYLAQHYKLPPLLNPYICHHGRQNIRIQEMTKCNKINYIPVEIYNFLVDTFGGRKINQKTLKQAGQQCKLCVKGLDTLNELKTIQKSVMKYVDNFSVKKGQVLIYKPWLDQWKAYLYEKSKENYTQWGNPPPTEINNYLGMKQNNPKTIDYTKYSKISFEVWLALSMFHCGGPQLTIKKVVKNNGVKNYVQLRLEEVKQMYVQLGKCLSPQTKKVMKIIGNLSTLHEIKEDENDDEQILSGRGLEEDNLVNELKKIQKSQSKQKQKQRQRQRQRQGGRLFSREKSNSLVRNKH